MTIAIYHQEEDARKLLDSIMRERSQEEKDLATKVLEGKSSTEPVCEGPDSLPSQSMQTLYHGDRVNDSRSITTKTTKAQKKENKDKAPVTNQETSHFKTLS